MNGERRIGRLEPIALWGVMSRDIAVFSKLWPSISFSAVVEPTMYLLAFGFGFGALVSQVAGYDYIDFVGTGTVATAVLFGSAFSAMFGTWVKRQFQHTYDALLATPVDVEEIVTAEVLWLGMRAAVFGMAPLVVAVAFGLRPGPGVVLVPAIGLLTGLGFASLGYLFAAFATSMEIFNYIISAVLTPLFLVAGTFFPISELPRGVQIAANANPLYHCVELVRHAVFDLDPVADLAHAAALIAFALVVWRLAIWRTRIRLID
jgi:lipooligosaccharide transport system permease protein